MRFIVYLFSSVVFSLTGISSTHAQVSFGFQFGHSFVDSKVDPYGLKSIWPLKTSGVTSPTMYYDGGTGASIKVYMNWEFTPILSAGLFYKKVEFEMDENHRLSHFNSWGFNVKANFVDNNSKLVPYIQGSYIFSVASFVQQSDILSPSYPAQFQPGFEKNFYTSMGFGGDLGLEIKLRKTLAFVIEGGYHTTQMMNSAESTFTANLNYGVYQSPTKLEGVNYFLFTGGLKYYIGKQKKKRDF
ncbi:MAG TPA: hypothetical protein PLR06_00210 [Cyclobacteriaceae bacterium]|nr:hypothetical protein [Cyclobacteriaceae bacterium]